MALELTQFADLYRSISTHSATNIRALNSTPRTVFPAMGTDTVIVPVYLEARMTFGTSAFTGANALEFRWTDGSGDKCLFDIPSAFLTAVANQCHYTLSSLVAAFDATAKANAPVVAYVPSANPGGASATGSMELICYARLLKI